MGSLQILRGCGSGSVNSGYVGQGSEQWGVYVDSGGENDIG